MNWSATRTVVERSVGLSRRAAQLDGVEETEFKTDARRMHVCSDSALIGQRQPIKSSGFNMNRRDCIDSYSFKKQAFRIILGRRQYQMLEISIFPVVPQPRPNKRRISVSVHFTPI